MHRKRFAPVWAALALLLVAGLACNLATPATPTPTPVPILCRRTTDTVSDPAQPSDNITYQAAIAEYLTRGGQPEELERILGIWGILGEHGTVDATHDLTGDYILDVVVTFHYPSASTTLQPPGQLLVLNCETSTDGRTHYEVIYGLSSAPGDITSMPQIVTIDDLTGDYHPELVYYTEQCTTLACYREPVILSWNSQTNHFDTLSRQFAAHYPNSSEVRGFPGAGFEIGNADPGSPRTFIVREGPPVRREAGPYRPVLYTWRWVEPEFVLASDVYAAPAQYRIQAVLEADASLISGNIEAAIDQYEAILENPTLEAWGGIESDDKDAAYEELMLNNYVRYRLVLAHAAVRDGQDADVLNAMNDEARRDPDKDYTAYTELARIFREAYYTHEAGGDPLRAACIEVEQAAADVPFTYEFLNDREYFGLAIAPYSLDDLCPF